MEGSVVCPVCTLYLRPGMTLKSHLESHPKQKVIEALVKLHSDPVGSEAQAPVSPSTEAATSEVFDQHIGSAPATPWMGQATATTSTYMPAPTHMAPQGFPAMGPSVVHPASTSTAAAGAPGNHSFFYQQIIGSSAQPQGGYLIPVFNQQMQQGGIIPAPGYMYHQQQMFVSSGAPAGGGGGGGFPLRMLPIADGANQLAPAIEYKGAHIVEINESDALKEYKDQTPGEKQAMPDLKCQIEDNVEIVTPCEDNVEVALTPDEPPPQLHAEVAEDEEDMQDKFKDMATSPKYITLNTVGHTFEGAAEEEHQHYELDGMNIVLVNDYNSRGHVPLQVADECEEGISIDSAHIRADENMPQESNSNASWSRAQFHEGSSRMSTYDLLARESWEGSDASDVDADAPPPYQSHYYVRGAEDEDIMISSTSRQGIEYKCSSCPSSFVCPKERRVHQAEVHSSSEAAQRDTKEPPPPPLPPPPSSTATTLIGAGLYSKKVKKLVIKPKQTKLEMEQLKTEKVEPSFDQIFTNIMKVEDERLLACEAAGADPLKLDRNETLPSLVVETITLGSGEPVVTIPPPSVICVLCCTLVRDCRTLRQHQVTIHEFTPAMKYKCGVCGDGFNTEPSYTEHLTVHPLECLFCGKYFYRAHNMQLHIKRHLGIRPYGCPTCAKSFLTRQKLQEHQYMHTGETPLKCGLCDESFKRYSNLIQHRNRHHLHLKRRQKDFICATCGDVFHSKKKLAWHKEVHEHRPKACLHCSEKFVHQSSLTRHVRRTHNERFVPAEGRDIENVECPVCKGVYLRGSLETHMKSHAPRKGFSCSVCDKEFSTKWNLKLHKWTHAGRAQKPFKCELCKGAFVRESDYTAHMNSHRAIRPYTCNYCGAQFIRKYNCQRHVKEHERNKTFNCNVCGKTFHRSYYLNDHMRIHSGVRPFSCHICGKTSTTKSNHNKHVRIHHAREPVSTEN